MQNMNGIEEELKEEDSSFPVHSYHQQQDQHISAGQQNSQAKVSVHQNVTQSGAKKSMFF